MIHPQSYKEFFVPMKKSVIGSDYIDFDCIGSDYIGSDIDIDFDIDSDCYCIDFDFDIDCNFGIESDCIDCIDFDYFDYFDCRSDIEFHFGFVPRLYNCCRSWSLRFQYHRQSPLAIHEPQYWCQPDEPSFLQCYLLSPYEYISHLHYQLHK